jgi:hypothetical protein
MQIHELTQPRKPQLDEIFNTVGDAIQSGGTTLMPTNAGRQARINAQVARSAAKLSSQGYTGEGPTLGQSLQKFQQNPAAQQWVKNIVAKWPAQAQLLKTPTTPVTEEEPVYLPGSKKPLDPNNPQDAQVLAAMTKQGLTPPVTTKAVSSLPKKRKQPTVTPTAPVDPVATAQATYRAKFREWINQQLKTISLDTLEQDTKVKTLIEPLIKIVVDNQNNLPEQQRAIAQLLGYAVAANHQGQKQSGPRIGYGSTVDNTNVAIPLDGASELKLTQELRTAGVRKLRSTRNPAVDGMFQKLGITIIP